MITIAWQALRSTQKMIRFKAYFQKLNSIAKVEPKDITQTLTFNAKSFITVKLMASGKEHDQIINELQ